MNTDLVIDVKTQIEEALFKVVKRDVKNIFFVSCGGSFALMYLSKYLVDREAKTIDAHIYSSNEFLYRNHARLGGNSVVLFCSHSGNTPETVAASELAKSKGALTISLTNELGTKLPNNCDINLKYEWGDDAYASSHSLLYLITFGILQVIENNEKFALIDQSLENLQQVFEGAIETTEQQGEEFAKSHKDEKVIYSMASGVNYGVAYSFAICSMMEQQWIHSNAIHAGEFFHGPFEILDEDVPFVILVGLDETRPIEERALEFSKRYGKKLTVVDAKDFNLDGIDESVKGYIAALVLNHVVRNFAERLSVVRNHPLSTRRYMWTVEY